MAFAWHGLMPALTRFVGYFPADRLGLGEDLPAGMALEWAERRSPELRLTDLKVNGAEPAGERRLRLLEHCASLQCPALAISISDDAFATVDGTKRLLSYFPNLTSAQHLLFSPPDAQVRRIGHFGFFRRAVGTTLWPRLLVQLQLDAGQAESAAQPAIARGSATSGANPS
jgi:predicted alpha/beta hydrolase